MPLNWGNMSTVPAALNRCCPLFRGRMFSPCSHGPSRNVPAEM